VAVPDSEGITLVFKVVEKPYNYLRAGARYDLEYNSKAFVDLVSDNVFGGGQEMFLSTTIGEKRRSVALNFQSDRILKTLFTGNFTVDFGELKLNQYRDHEYIGYLKQTSYGAELAPGRQIPQLGTIMIVGQLRNYSWREPDKPDRREFTKFSIGLRSLVDSRDALSFPDRGKHHVFSLQFASDIRDEKTAYTRFYTSIEAYYPLTKRLNFHPRLAVGASSDFMPYFDEFSLGGLDNFLGLYQDEHLGDKLLLGSLELRQKIGDRFYLLARYNTGNIWNKLETVRLSNLLHGAGFGMALKTPIGPVESWYGSTFDGLDAFYLNIGYRW
jgi:outer membrane protein assembly factor BamA